MFVINTTTDAPVTSVVVSVSDVIARSVSSVFSAASSLVTSVIAPSVASIACASAELATSVSSGMVTRKGKGRPPAVSAGYIEVGKGKKKAAAKRKGKGKEEGVQTDGGGEVAETDGGEVNETEDENVEEGRQEEDTTELQPRSKLVHPLPLETQN